MVEEKILQPVVKEVEEPKKKEPEGYYFAEVPTGKKIIIALGNKEIEVDQLIIDMANCLRENGLLK